MQSSEQRLKIALGQKNLRGTLQVVKADLTDFSWAKMLQSKDSGGPEFQF